MLRYRARREWFGFELFDRVEGRVIPLDRAQSDRCFALKTVESSSPDSEVILLPGLLNNEDIAVESLIDTPYRKMSSFASAPRRIYWELTRHCNLNCRSCFNRHDLDRPEMSPEEILVTAKEMYVSGVYEIRCTGGEPTIRPDFFEIAEELFQTGFYLSMGTNGCYSAAVLEKVKKSPIDWIILSIDGSSEETFAEVRGNNAYRTVLRTLEAVASWGKRIRVNTLIRKNNHTYEHLKGLAVLCDRYGVESLNCIPMRPMVHDQKILAMQLTRLEFSEFIKALYRLRQQHATDFITTLDLRHTVDHDRVYYKDKSCAAGREGAVVSPYGEIYGCSYSLASDPNAPEQERKKYVAGNILEEEFLEIWNDSARWSIYRDLEQYKNEACKECDYYISKRCIGNCPIMNQNNPGAFDPYCYLFNDISGSTPC